MNEAGGSFMDVYQATSIAQHTYTYPLLEPALASGQLSPSSLKKKPPIMIRNDLLIGDKN